MTKQQIIDEAMKLDSDDQEDIAECVWRIAHGASREEIQAEWASEIRRRLDALQRGEVILHDSDEVVRRLRAKRPA